MVSGTVAIKQANRITTTLPKSGQNLKAKNKPKAKDKTVSATIRALDLFETLPVFLTSVKIWEFQWGTKSVMKWARKARGRLSIGLLILVAIVAPMIVCGNSNTVRKSIL